MIQTIREQQLRHLADQLGILHKAILLKYGDQAAPLSPVLSKVVMIIGGEGNINIKRIATLLMISSAAATQHVAMLEEQGIVTRRMGTVDRREIIVSLTSIGMTLYADIRKKSLAMLHEVFDVLTESELDQFNGLITKVRTKYTKKEQL